MGGSQFTLARVPGNVSGDELARAGVGETFCGSELLDQPNFG